MNLAGWLQVCSGITHSTARWFHVWFLPAVWLVAEVTLWTIILALNLRGDASFYATFAGTAGFWLVDIFDKFGHGRPVLLDLLAICIGGAMVMGVAGLFQDLLRVSKRILWVYSTVWLSVFAIGCVVLGQGAELNLYLQVLLFVLCWSLYVFAFLSIAGYSVLRAWQAVVRILRYPE